MTSRKIEQQANETIESARSTADAAGDVADRAADTGRSALDTLGQTASDVVHAAVGAVDLTIKKLQGRSDAEVLPGDSDDATKDRARSAFDRLSTRGRVVTHRLSRQARETRADVRETADEARERGASAVSSVEDRVADELSAIERRVSDADDRPEQPGVPYETRTADELRRLAAERDIPGRSTMTKEELVAALRG